MEPQPRKGRCVAVDVSERKWTAIVVPKKAYDELPIPPGGSDFWSAIGVNIAGSATYEDDSSFDAQVTIARHQLGQPVEERSFSGTVFFVSRSANLKRMPRAIGFLEQLRIGQHAAVTVTLGRRR